MPIDEAIDNIEEPTQSIIIIKPELNYPQINNLDAILAIKSRYKDISERFPPNDYVQIEEDVDVISQQIEYFFEFKSEYLKLYKLSNNLICELNKYVEMLGSGVEGIVLEIITKGLRDEFTVPKSMYEWITGELDAKISALNDTLKNIEYPNNENNSCTRNLIGVNTAIIDVYNENDVIMAKMSAMNLMRGLEHMQKDLFYRSYNNWAEEYVNGFEKILKFSKGKQRVSFILYSDKVRRLEDKSPRLGFFSKLKS
jgi:hypothetical protein